jgi:8-oxo-dGTP pyrophosphatase MutT (NUDIX family)
MSPDRSFPAGTRVQRVEACDLVSISASWEFADLNREAIEMNWRQRCAENPAFFNGTVHLLREHSFEGPAFRAVLVRTPFKEFLYWKDTGYPDSRVFDVFGSALLRSCEGHVILGRQREGNLNAGLVYLPGGFIDERDVSPDGRVDISRSILRELSEEIGLELHLVEQQPGFMVSFAGQLASIAAEFRSPLPAAQIVERFEHHILGNDSSELASIEVVPSVDALDRLAVPQYADAIIRTALRGP